MSEGAKFYLSLFDERINFAIWKTFVVDWLVLLGNDDALGRERPTHTEEGRCTSMKKKAMSTLWLAISPEIKYH